MDSILFIHRSRVVRATLGLHLKSYFEILEAPDSEAGWQLLVLHHGIVAAVCGLDVSQENDTWATSTRISGVDTQLSGIELLDRVRHSNLARLKNLPFYLIGSETHIAEIADEAHQHKVTGFLYNGMSRREILSTLNITEMEAETGENFQKEGEGASGFLLPSQSFSAPVQPANVSLQSLHRVDLISAGLFRENLERLFIRPGTQAAVLVFGIDGYAEIGKQFGAKVADNIVTQCAKLVQAKLRSSDVLGYAKPGAFAVVTLVTQVEKCMTFSERVVRSLSAAKISLHGNVVKFSVSAGVANSVVDNVKGVALLEMAQSRLDQVSAAGGGRVQAVG
jgi:diguanylate cyclase (GGDEF)-like protein